MKRTKIWLTFSFFLMVLGVMGIRPLQAANAVVGTGTGASCTEAALNAALTTVQASSNGTVTFNCGGAATITLTSGKIITKAVTIDGGGNITLNGGNAVRHFYVDIPAGLTLENITLRNGYDNTYGGGSILSLGTLTLTNSTIRDSNVSASYSGGAIMSLGPVTMSGSLIENNTGGSVGGLYLFGENADATVTNSTFRNNRTTNASFGFGGALTAWDGADVTLHNTMFDQNAANYGGAIYNSFANTTIIVDTSSVLKNNFASSSGGGIFNDGGSITLMNVELSDNSAQLSGGAIHNLSGTIIAWESNLANNSAEEGGSIFSSGSLAVLYTKISHNTAVLGGGISNKGSAILKNSLLNENSATNNGGGIYHIQGGSLTLSNVTISGNSANQGGGIYSTGDGSLIFVTMSGNSAPTGGALWNSGNSFTLKDVILNTGTTGANCAYSVPIVSIGFNIVSDNSCGFSQIGDQNNVNPILGPLADNGGPTPTHLPQAGSPVLNSGQCVIGQHSDQRGMARPQAGLCDKGAVEGNVSGGIIFNNGPLYNVPRGGFGGADASTVQTALGMSLYGLGAQIGNNNSVADDFTVPGGEKWQVDTMTFFLYQTNSTSTSTITGMNVNVYAGNPATGGQLIASSSNVLRSSWSAGYRTFDTSTANSDRPIMATVVMFSDLTLYEGTYWLEWQAVGTLSSGPWVPLVTINGLTATGNALSNVAGVWDLAIDTSVNRQQGLPFTINGMVSPFHTVFLPMITNN